jgi:nitrogen-specific signal transduction histidine kinase
MDMSSLLSQKDILQLVSMREVLAGFSHEIAQPLNAIMIAVQVLQLKVQRCGLAEEEKSFLINRLGVVSSQAQRATHIVDSFRSFSKPRSPSATADVTSSFRTVHSLMEPQFMGRGLDLVWEFADPLPTANWDSHAVELILVQGLAFARDCVEALGEWHTQSGLPYSKTVTVKLTACGGRPTARIVWEKGKVGKDSTMPVIGTPVGLALAASILKSSDGSLVAGPSSVLITFP